MYYCVIDVIVIIEQIFISNASNTRKKELFPIRFGVKSTLLYYNHVTLVIHMLY